MQFVSGKLVIITILTVAFSAAGVSWWFRYAATHRAAEFWGPAAVRLIRDAPVVLLQQRNKNGALPDVGPQTAPPTNGIDISRAPGLTHLRNALLEDRSYRWPPHTSAPDNQWRWALYFVNGQDRLTLLFSPHWKSVRKADDATVLSSEPIAGGLEKMLASIAEQSAAR